MTTAKSMLTEHLKNSTIRPSSYAPSMEMINGHHSAVFCGNAPVFLCGPAKCKKSNMVAKRLADSPEFKLALEFLNIEGKIKAGTLFGAELDWEQRYECIAASKSGVIELFDSQSQLIGVNLTQSRELSVVLSVNSELARVFDSQCPELDDGITLGHVIQLETGTTI